MEPVQQSLPPQGVSIQQKFLNLWEPASRKISGFFKNHETFKKVCRVALVIFVIMLTAFSYWANPFTTLAGIFVGIIFPEKVQNVSDRIKDFLKKGWWPYVTLISVAAFALLPLAVYMGGTFLWSAHVGKWATESYTQDNTIIQAKVIRV